MSDSQYKYWLYQGSIHLFNFYKAVRIILKFSKLSLALLNNTYKKYSLILIFKWKPHSFLLKISKKE